MCVVPLCPPPLSPTGAIVADEERSFLLDEYLELHPSTYEGNPSFVWRDVDDEDTQAQFELVIDSNRADRVAIEAFYSAMLRVMYERKMHKPADKLSIPQLENALHMYVCNVDLSFRVISYRVYPKYQASLAKDRFLFSRHKCFV